MGETDESLWRREPAWAPRDLDWRAGALFMVGSACFALGSLPVYFLAVPPRLVGITFFVGSVYFTSAGVTQLQQLADGGRWLQFHRTVWWAAAVQFVGMLFFNLNTFRSAFGAIPSDDVNRLIWAPDLFGSIAFLVASHLAWIVVCGRLWRVDRESADWWMAALNYAGSIFFMLAALAAFTLPTTGDLVNLALVNAGTFFGAVGFFLGGYLLMPARSDPPLTGV